MSKVAESIMYRNNVSLAPANANKLQSLPTEERAVPQVNTSHKAPECYQSDHRYFCKEHCCWKRGCKALVADWLRKN